MALLLLPAEIRNKIYEYAVAQPEPVELRQRDNAPPHFQPAIARASRQLRQETLGMFFELNTFVFLVPARQVDRQWENTVPQGMTAALGRPYTIQKDYRTKAERDMHAAFADMRIAERQAARRR